MTVLLEEAFDKVSRLPETLQDEIAKELLANIDTDSRWQKISEHVKNLVESNRVEDARKVLSTIQTGNSVTLDRWIKTLTEPKAVVEKGSSAKNIKDEAVWLKQNSEDYKGKWVALKNGELLGADKSRITLHTSLKQTGNLSGAMFFRIDN